MDLCHRWLAFYELARKLNTHWAQHLIQDITRGGAIMTSFWRFNSLYVWTLQVWTHITVEMGVAGGQTKKKKK